MWIRRTPPRPKTVDRFARCGCLRVADVSRKKENVGRVVYAFVGFAKWLLSQPGRAGDPGMLTALARLVEPPAKSVEEKRSERPSAKGRPSGDSFVMAALHVAFCAVGIVVSYVLWGYMQERIMTQPYATGELFRSSKFLVFANRALALLVAYAAREAQRAQGACVSHTAPLYQFSFSSVSNILSSVSQYEALRYISFPTQALASRPGATALASRGGAAPLLSPPPRRWKVAPRGAEVRGGCRKVGARQVVQDGAGHGDGLLRLAQDLPRRRVRHRRPADQRRALSSGLARP